MPAADAEPTGVKSGEEGDLAARPLSVAGGPQAGFAEHTSAEGTYRGEWANGRPHGTGSFLYTTGVRYRGSWRDGRPCGEGVWTREKPRKAPPPKPRVAKCKCNIPVRNVERQLLEPIGFSVFLRHLWPPGVDDSDRTAFARHVACWWPGGASDLGARLKDSSPRCFADFYKRVLSEQTKVEVLAVNELPLGSRDDAPPKVLLEIWCSDPARRDQLSGGRGMPVAVLYIHFRQDFSQASVARHSSVRCMHIAFCRIQDDWSEGFQHTQGVENFDNLWAKLEEVEENLDQLHTIEVRDSGWRWRQPWECCVHCAKLDKGGCGWTPTKSVTPLRSNQGVVDERDCETVCEECLAFASASKLLRDALDLESTQTKGDQRFKLPPIVSPKNVILDGLCLPISVAEHKALASYQHVAMILPFVDQDRTAQASGLTRFCEYLHSLHWKTMVMEKCSKIAAERAVAGNISSAKFRQGANLFLFAGHVVRIRESTYILSDEVRISSSFHHNRAEWEDEIKAKGFSLDWFQEKLASVRAYGSYPSLIIIDSVECSGDSHGAFVPTCKHRVSNSLMVRSFAGHEAQNNPWELGPNKVKHNSSKFLARLQFMMIQRCVDVMDILMRINSEFESSGGESAISLDYDGMREYFSFHPPIGHSRNFEVQPEDRLGVALSFRLPLTCGSPPEAISGKPDFMNRKVRLASLGSGSQDCLDYLEGRFQDLHLHGKCLLHGDHGSGKTTTAAALMHRLYWKRSFNAFFWLHGATSAVLYHDLMLLARYLDLVDDQEERFEPILARVQQWMISHPGWCVILDDVEDESVVDLLNFPVDNGMLLVTSRPAAWYSIPWQNIVELGPVTADEGHAMALLSVRNEEPYIVDVLLRELHHHPLCLQIALSCMKQDKLKIAKYMLKKKPLDHSLQMQYCSAGMTSQEREYLFALLSVVPATIHAFNAYDSKLQTMLVACACSHGNGIPRSLFQEEPLLDDFMDTLLRYGFVQVSGDATIHMNPLLQLAIREHFENLHDVGLQHLCSLLEKEMLVRDKGTCCIRPDRGSWLVHVLEADSLGGIFSFPFLRAVAEYMSCHMQDFDEPLRLLQGLWEQATSKDKDYSRILSLAFHIGQTHVRRQEYSQGQYQLMQFVSMFESLDCHHDGMYARSISLIGDCLRALGKHSDALNRYEHVLQTLTHFETAEFNDRQAEDWYPFFVRLRLNMKDVSDFEASSRQFVVDLAKATEVPVDRLAIIRASRNTRQSPFQEMEPECMIVEMTVKADIEWNMPSKEECIEPVLFVRRLQDLLKHKAAQRNRHKPEENALAQGRMTQLIDYASCPALEGGQDKMKLFKAEILCKIGDTSADLENHEFAESNYIQALHVQRTSLVSDQESVSNTLLRIAESRRRQRKLDKALEVIEECRGMRVRTLGHDHCSVAEIHEISGKVRLEQGNFLEAMLSFDRAKRIYRTRLGPESWEAAQAAVCVGIAQDELGQLDSAISQYEEALKVLESFQDTLNASRCVNNLATIHRKKGDFTQALTLLQKTKASFALSVGETSLEFAGILRNIGNAYFGLEQWQSAQAEWEEALSIIEGCGTQAKESRDFALTKMNIGSAHLKLSRYHDAHDSYLQAYSILCKEAGPRHLDTARALVGLGSSNEKMGNLELARTRLTGALANMREALGETHLEVCSTELNLASVLFHQAISKAVPHEDGAFPVSASFFVELNMRSLEGFEDDEASKKSLIEHLSSVAGVPPSQLKIQDILHYTKTVEMRVYRGAPEASKPSQVVSRLLLEARNRPVTKRCDSDIGLIDSKPTGGSKLFDGRWGSKIRTLSGREENSVLMHEALCLYNHVVQTRTAKFGNCDLDVANALRCIGDIHMSVSTAGSALNSAPHSASDLKNTLKNSLGADRTQAVAEYWQALRIFEVSLGKEHKDTVSTHANIEAALNEELLLAKRDKEIKEQSAKESRRAADNANAKRSQGSKQHRELIAQASKEAEEEAITYLQSVEQKLEECKRWKNPNPLQRNPGRMPLLRTRRFKLSGSDFGPENRGKFGTVDSAAHDDGFISLTLDNGLSKMVSGLDFEKNAFYVLPEGLEQGRAVVITGLHSDKKFNGVHGVVKDTHKTDPSRIYVGCGIDNLELEVKYENCEFQLPPGYRQGLRVRIMDLSADNIIYNGCYATIVRAFEQDPGRILVQLDNGQRMVAAKLENIEIMLPQGYLPNCRVETHSLKKASENGKFGKVVRADESDHEFHRAIVLLDPVGELKVGITVSIDFKNLKFALPAGLSRGREVSYNGVKGSVVRADDLDCEMVVVIFHENIATTRQTQTGKTQIFDKEQSIPLKEIIFELPPNLEKMMAVKLKDLTSKSYNDRHGSIRQASAHDPERVVVELEDGERVEVRVQNLTVIG